MFTCSLKNLSFFLPWNGDKNVNLSQLWRLNVTVSSPRLAHRSAWSSVGPTLFPFSSHLWDEWLRTHHMSSLNYDRVRRVAGISWTHLHSPGARRKVWTWTCFGWCPFSSMEVGLCCPDFWPVDNLLLSPQLRRFHNELELGLWFSWVKMPFSYSVK